MIFSESRKFARFVHIFGLFIDGIRIKVKKWLII